MGEAATQLPYHLKAEFPEMPWLQPRVLTETLVWQPPPDWR